MNDFITWMVNSGKVTDWILVIFTFILLIPVLISLNEKYKWYTNSIKKIKKIIKKRKKISLFIRRKISIYRIKKYFNNLDYSNELYLKSFKIVREKKSIHLLFESYNDSILIFLSDSSRELFFDKYKLKKFKKELPIKVAIFIFDEIINKGKNVESFTRNGRLSEYLNKKYLRNEKVPSI